VYSSKFLAALDGGEWSGSRPYRFTPGERFGYPSYRLSVPQIQSGCCGRKKILHFGKSSSTNRTCCSSLYLLNYTTPLLSIGDLNCYRYYYYYYYHTVIRISLFEQEDILCIGSTYFKFLEYSIIIFISSSRLQLPTCKIIS
jgi:hypothetical protein